MSSEAAQTLVKLVDERGFVAPAQYVLMKLLDLMSGCYAAHPELIKSDHRSLPKVMGFIKSQTTSISYRGFESFAFNPC